MWDAKQHYVNKCRNVSPDNVDYRFRCSFYPFHIAATSSGTILLPCEGGSENAIMSGNVVTFPLTTCFAGAVRSMAFEILETLVLMIT